MTVAILLMIIFLVDMPNGDYSKKNKKSVDKH